MEVKTSQAVAKIDRNQSIMANYTTEQIAVIKEHVAKGATNDELVYFLQVCKAQNLDPFSRQIYFVKRGNQMNIQTGIDGYRAIAEQTGRLAGIEDPSFNTETAKHPDRATVTVRKFVKGEKVSFTASARWAEYYPGDKMGFMWNKMPYLMLGKVAEALALRKAFPKNLGNIYTEEETQRGDEIAIETNADLLKVESFAPEMITMDQGLELESDLKRVGKRKEGLLSHLRKETLMDLTYHEARTWITSLKAQPSASISVSSPSATNAANVVPETVISANAPLEGEIIEEMPHKETIKPKSPEAHNPNEPIAKAFNKIMFGQDDAPPPQEEEMGPMRKAMNKIQAEKERKSVSDNILPGFIPIPGEICEFINLYSTRPEAEWPDGFKELRDDCNKGSFRGKTAYPKLF